MMQTIIACVITAVVALAIGIPFGIQWRRRVAEKEISSAEEEAKRIINESIKSAESKKREALVEAKEEILQARNEYEREVKERRADLQKQERRLQQKEIDDLLRLVKLQKDSAPRLAIQQNGKTQKLPLSELMVLEQQGHHVVLSLKGGSTIQLYGKLSDLLPQLEGQPFFCPHKSYCVNLAFVRGINEEYQSYELADGKKVPISRPNRTKAKRAWEDFLFAQTRGET